MPSKIHNHRYELLDPEESDADGLDVNETPVAGLSVEVVGVGDDVTVTVE